MWEPLSKPNLEPGASSLDIQQLAQLACRTEQLAHFLRTLRVPLATSKTVAKFVEHGRVDPFSLLCTDSATMATWPGFASRLSTKLARSFSERSKCATAAQWTIAADAFGRSVGEQKLLAAVRAAPALVSDDASFDAGEARTALLSIRGVSQRTVDALLASRPGFLAYWAKIRAYFERQHGVDKTPQWTPQPPTMTTAAARVGSVAQRNTADCGALALGSRVIRFTGFRDEALAAQLCAQGAEVVTGGMTKRVNMLVWNDAGGKKKSAKVSAAADAGMDVWPRSAAWGAARGAQA